MKKIYLFCILGLLPYMLSAQLVINNQKVVYDKLSNTFLFSISKELFGTDFQSNITIESNSGWKNLSIENHLITENTYTFNDVEPNKKYTLKAADGNNETTSYITFTYLPIIELQGTFGYDYSQGTLTLYTSEKTEPITTNIKAKWRGGSTNSEGKHKRNYKIKTLDEKGNSIDYSFLGMRKDNNWILDAGQVDMFRMRNRIATELWNDFATKPYYASFEPKAQTGVNGKVVEVILNNEYRGIYSLTEAMDRKELKLKKYDEINKKIHGQLWKTSGYGYATFWDQPDEYDNNSETWNVFETKYPDIEDVCPTDYSLLWEAINFVATSDNTTFQTNVSEYFDIPVLIDYYIFLNVINGIDNIGKNMYWAVYDKQNDKKMTPSIWDLDATVGQNYTDNPLHPDMVAPNSQLNLSALNLYNRLIQLNVDNFKEKIYNRYKELRQSYLTEEALLQRYHHYLELIQNSGAASREEIRWSGDTDIAGYSLNFQQEYSYIEDWIKQRLAYIDKEFSALTTNICTLSIDKKKENSTYNILGQRVKKMEKGNIYIINGKKYIK